MWRLTLASVVLFPLSADCPVLLCRGRMPRARGMAACVRDGYRAFRQPQFERGCCKMLVFRVCGAKKNLYVFSLYRNPMVDNADLLSDHFDGKESKESVDLPLSCHPTPILTTFAFRPSEVRRLLFDLDPYGGTDPLGMFLFFLRELPMFCPPVLVQCFGCLFVWVVSQLDGDRPMSPLFRMVHHPPLLPITDRFP